MAFLECADYVRYKTLWHSLMNNPLIGADDYPKKFTDSFNLISNDKPLVTHTIPLDGGGKQRGKILQFV